MSSESTKNTFVWFVIFLGAFCAYFFTLDFPEIRYGPVNLQVQNATLFSRYCCGFQCICTISGEPLAEKCNASMVQQAESSLSPQGCSAGNGSLCPVTGGDAMCDGGYTCCKYCYDGDGGTYCCKSSRHGLCQLNCHVCYTVDLVLEFSDRHGVSRNNTISKPFDKDMQGAQRFLDTHRPNTTFHGYYKPSDSSIVFLHRRYTAYKWGLLVLFIVPLFICSFMLTHFLIAHIVGNAREAIVWKMNVALWIGIVWPLLVFLPTLQLGDVTTRAWKRTLIVFIPLFGAIGWTPLVLQRLESVGWSSDTQLSMAVCFGLLPVSILVPVLVFYPSTHIPLAIVLGIMLLVLLAAMVLGPHCCCPVEHN